LRHRLAVLSGSPRPGLTGAPHGPRRPGSPRARTRYQPAAEPFAEGHPRVVATA